MARIKVTNADINARLARGECANYRQNGCRGQSPCTIIVGEPCDYFNRYVKPLLDYQEFSTKYQREAKVTVAINPNARVVRTRRTSVEPRLSLDAAPVKIEAPRPVKKTPVAKTLSPSKPLAKSEKPEKIKHAPVTPKKVTSPPPTPPVIANTHRAMPVVPALELSAPTIGEKPTRAIAPCAKTLPAKPVMPIPPHAPQLVLELTPSYIPAKKMARKR